MPLQREWLTISPSVIPFNLLIDHRFARLFVWLCKSFVSRFWPSRTRRSSGFCENFLFSLVRGRRSKYAFNHRDYSYIQGWFFVEPWRRVVCFGVHSTAEFLRQSMEPVLANNLRYVARIPGKLELSPLLAQHSLSFLRRIHQFA